MKPHRLLRFGTIACGIFIVVAWVGASTSGWSELASRFPFHGRTPDTLLSTNRIVLSRPGGSPFTLKGTVRAAVTAEGLYLAQRGPFRLFSPPLLVPWTAVTAYSRTDWGGGVADTNVITSVGFQIAIPDPGNIVLAECQRQHIPEVGVR